MADAGKFVRRVLVAFRTSGHNVLMNLRGSRRTALFAGCRNLPLAPPSPAGADTRREQTSVAAPAFARIAGKIF